MKQLYYLFFCEKKKFLKLVMALALFILSYVNLNAQVSAYTFSQSSGTYSAISGATVLGTATGNTAATNLSSTVFPIILPFNFNFNGTSYSSLNVSANGFITFGAVLPSTSNTTPISGSVAYDGAVSAWGRSLSSFFDINGRTGNISWATVGTAPNREVIIQWSDFRVLSSTSTTNVYSFSFQIRLQETSNLIRAVYDSGSFLVGNTAITGTAQIGLRGSTNTDFNNRLNSTTTEFINSGAGTANNSTQAFNTSNTIPGTPAAGLTYTWTPPTCYAPVGFSVVSTTANTADVTWSPSPSSPGGYDIYYSTSSTPPIATTTPTISNVLGTNYQITGLTPLTPYYVWIRSNCGAGNTSVWSSENLLFITTNCVPPSVLSSTGATVCSNQTATLSATANAGIDLNWYDSQTGGNLLSTGSSFTTPTLANTTNYYVSASSGTGDIQTGKNTFSPSPSSGAGTTNFGLVFDALSFFILESVTVYPVSSTNASGTLTIDVIDSNGVVLNSKTVNVTGAPTSAPVAQVINLNFPILPGTNYKIRPRGYTGITGLLFDPSANAPGGNYGYPYNVQNLVTIQTSTLTATPTNTPRNDLYYYFYNWKVGTKCESARAIVTATVDSASCLSTAEAEKQSAVRLYPNPFTDTINIDRPELINLVQITDVSGRLIKNNMKAESVLRLNDLSSGTYILILNMKNGSAQSLKVIKK